MTHLAFLDAVAADRPRLDAVRGAPRQRHRVMAEGADRQRSHRRDRLACTQYSKLTHVLADADGPARRRRHVRQAVDTKLDAGCDQRVAVVGPVDLLSALGRPPSSPGVVDTDRRLSVKAAFHDTDNDTRDSSRKSS